MTIDADKLKVLIEAELACVHDPRVVAHVRSLIVDPFCVLCGWDYGPAGQQYLCWIVLKDGDFEIAYCEEGFGPTAPWGLMMATEYRHIGMESGWFRSLMDAYFESASATSLSIWRVFRNEPDSTKTTLTEEGGWDATWRDSTKDDWRSFLMSCPKQTILGCVIDNKTYKATEICDAENVYVVLLDGHPLNLRVRNTLRDYPGPKYYRVAFMHKAHAVRGPIESTRNFVLTSLRCI